jgi:hypothetical protein
MYGETVSRLEAIIQDLKSLPPDKLEMAANYITQLKPMPQNERQAILARTAGALSREEADEMDRVIAEGCENVDVSGW